MVYPVAVSPSQPGEVSYRHLWLTAAAVGLEATVVALVVSSRADLPVTPFSLAVAGVVLLTALVPALVRPTQQTALAACLATFFAGFLAQDFGFSILLLSPNANPSPLAQMPAFAWLHIFNLLGFTVLVFHFTARYPLRSPVSNRMIGASYLVAAALAAGLLLAPSRLWKGAVLGLAALWVAQLLARTFYQLFTAGRNLQPEKQPAAAQARLLLFSVLLANTLLILQKLTAILGIRLIPYDLALAAQVFLPAGIAYATLRTDLFGIDRAIRRATGYAAVSLLLLAIYMGFTVTLTALLAQAVEEFRLAAAVAGVIAAAAVFEPLRRRVQPAVDRVFYPERMIFRKEVGAAQAFLEQVVSREEVLNLLRRDLPAQIGAASAHLSLAPAPDIPDPAQPEPVWNCQLIVGGQALGRYWLGPRQGGQTFDIEEQAQLDTLARQAALALAYADSFEALQQLNLELETRVNERTRQVLSQQRRLAAYDERQKLARDLHDSISQALFSIHLSARALHKLVRKDPEKAETGLHELEAAAQQAQTEMRSLLAQLRAPQPQETAEHLVDFGALVRQLGESFEADSLNSSRPMHIKLEVLAAIWLPANLANELVMAVREALTNALRHSGADEAACRVEVLPGAAPANQPRLVIQIIDKGRGFEAESTQAGHYGLSGIRERAAALGGEVQVTSQPGRGACILIEIPLPEETA